MNQNGFMPNGFTNRQAEGIDWGWRQSIFCRLLLFYSFPLLLVLSLAGVSQGCIPQHSTSPTALGNLGIEVNSPGDDYAPVLTDTSTLIFTSSRIRTGKVGLSEILSDKRPARLYIAMRLTAEWESPREYRVLLSDRSVEGLATISFPPQPNGLDAVAYITACDRKEGNGGCDVLLISSGKQERLITPGPGLNTEGWDGHPFATPDGKRLYFASERSGGYGGLDIWYVERQANGLWGSPHNAGSEVNSNRDELSPFFDAATGDLYFSAATPSDSLDIFVLRAGSEQREALPSPYNSPAADITPFLMSGRLYVASNREGGCGGYDLYSFPR